MARGDAKANPWLIIKAHRATYVDVVTHGRRYRDVALLEGVPGLALLVCLLVGVRLPVPTSVGLLTVAGLLSAFLFGLMLQMADRATTWADDPPERGPATSAHAEYLKELAANSGYASLVSIATCVAFVVASSTSGLPLRVSSAVGVALGSHLVLTLLMVMKRVFALTVERLNLARTGGGRRRAA